MRYPWPEMRWLYAALAVLLASGCAPAKLERGVIARSSDYLVVVAKPGDSLGSLAATHLGDRRKAWRIGEFNGITRVKAGKEIVVPLRQTNRAGLYRGGFIKVPILVYHHFAPRGQTCRQVTVTAEAFEAQLAYLKRHYKLVILSNVDNESFAASNAKLGVDFDAIYTAQDVGAYKPTPANFEYMLAHLDADLGLAKTDILHTAQSLFHDHAPARAFGLANAWIDRQGLAAGGSWGATAHVAERPAVDFLYPTLAAMAAEVAAS